MTVLGGRRLVWCVWIIVFGWGRCDNIQYHELSRRIYSYTLKQCYDRPEYKNGRSFLAEIFGNHDCIRCMFRPPWNAFLQHLDYPRCHGIHMLCTGVSQMQSHHSRCAFCQCRQIFCLRFVDDSNNRDCLVHIVFHSRYKNFSDLTFSCILQFLVGVTGFEPTTSTSRT